MTTICHHDNYISATMTTRHNENTLLSIKLSLSTEEDMNICAQYYEETGQHWDKSIMLYHKSGQVRKYLTSPFSFPFIPFSFLDT